MTGRDYVNTVGVRGFDLNNINKDSLLNSPSLDKEGKDGLGRSSSPDKMLTGSIVEDSIFKAGDSTLRINNHNNESTMSSRFLKVVAGGNYSEAERKVFMKYKEYAPKIELNAIVKARREL